MARQLHFYNNTQLLLLSHAQYEQRKSDKKTIIVLRVFDRPPEGELRKYRGKDLRGVKPNEMFTWNVADAIDVIVKNHTRYDPLQYVQQLIDDPLGDQTIWVVDIKPTNNHITLADRQLLEEWEQENKSRH